MQKLYQKLKKYNLDDAIKFEENDLQFIALVNLWNNLENKDISLFLFFILTNSLICYQLSSTGEEYWKEFWEKLEIYLNSNKTNFLEFFEWFLKNSKWNKRLLNVKTKRLEKIVKFYDIFKNKEEFYYENMLILRDDLSSFLKQKKEAKTIVFAVKMFSYWARICFNKLIYFPFEINIPIDSRLIKIFNNNSAQKNIDLNLYYKNLGVKLGIPELHLDAILWNNKNI